MAPKAPLYYAVHIILEPGYGYLETLSIPEANTVSRQTSSLQRNSFLYNASNVTAFSCLATSKTMTSK